MNDSETSANQTQNLTANSLTEQAADLNLVVDKSNTSMDRAMRYVDLYLRIIFLCLLCLFAFTTNIINMVVLFRQGVRSCVSLCLFCLSATDFLSTLAGLGTIPAKVMVYLNLRPGVDPYAIYFVTVFLSSIFYDISNTLTAFLSLERCLCVVLPLRFKDIFTFRRGTAAIVAIYLFVFGLNLPHFLSSGLEWKTSSQNSTYLGLWLSSDRVFVDFYLSIAVHFCLTTFNLLMVCVCTQVMLIALNRSSKFQGRKRKQKAESPMNSTGASEELSSESLNVFSIAEGKAERTSDRSPTTNNSEINYRRSDKLNMNKIQTPQPEANNKADGDILRKRVIVSNRLGSSRNLNVMKTVILLCIICFVSNIMRLAATTSSYIEPKLKLGREYDHWFQLALSIAYVFQICNCSLNIFVYYRFNQSFRTTFQKIFCCRSRPAK